MPMLTDPSVKYLPYTDVPFRKGYVRQWPTKRTTEAPLWLSTDLRDGNQALINPMNNTTKLELFRLLVKIGFKEIEVAYPSSSEPEFQFVRSLIENNEIPDDVAIQVISPAREDLLARSIASLAGAKHAILHLYNAVSPVFREVVFRNSKEATIDLTVNAVRSAKKLMEEETARSGTKFTLNYCPETFSQTEPEFAVELANRVLEEWGKATPEDKVYFNLAATVESAPSNHYADLVEYFSNNVNQRDSVVLSIHPHNDRGTGVAAAESGLLAGGSRIEGCLLGNGERTGNVDIITLAMNLYSQGISPNLDFSNLPDIVKTVTRCCECEVPVRYPYAGALVFSAFAGTHQDAIKKGLDAQELRWKKVDSAGEGTKHWAMPYIPLDPKDIGYGYENLIRVSSQSGKSGTAYVVKQTMMFDMPRRMQVSFYKVIQDACEESHKEMTPALITETFRQHYGLSSKPMGRLHLQSCQTSLMSPSSLSESSDGSDEESVLKFEGQVLCDNALRTVSGEGKDVIEAALDALDSDLDFGLSFGETFDQTLSADNLPQPKTVTYVELFHPGSQPSKSGLGSVWGVGVSSDPAVAKARAVVSAANILVGDRKLPRPKMVYTPRKDLSVARTTSESWREVILRTGHGIPPTPERELHFQPLGTSS
ncbi:2-isopropylmalate synthase (Alpha-isopropylmalate synthase) (Alpha-IPM synthetase) [Marasmius tenuissimus]|nr:2-isopropylmalate synthase (Alpha-isopropylmalate synthase) (Alpha-IPM synthetase) [Marasmius tenuissimus]